MGVFKGYQIEWINALTGEAIDTTEKISDSFGHLKLEFPGILTGNDTSPILFFKLYPYGDTFLSPIVSNEFEAALPQEFQLAEDLDPIEPTPWADSLNTSTFEISISPNPTNGLVNCVINGDFSDLKWILTSTNGETFAVGNITSPNFSIDLSVYSSGSYILLVQDKEGTLIQTVKIIKQ